MLEMGPGTVDAAARRLDAPDSMDAAPDAPGTLLKEAEIAPTPAELAAETFVLEVLGAVPGVKRVEYALVPPSRTTRRSAAAAAAVQRPVHGADFDMDGAAVVSVEDGFRLHFRTSLGSLFAPAATSYFHVFQLTNSRDGDVDKVISNVYGFQVKAGVVSLCSPETARRTATVDQASGRALGDPPNFHYGVTFEAPPHFTMDVQGVLKRNPDAPPPDLAALFRFEPDRVCPCCGMRGEGSSVRWLSSIQPVPRLAPKKSLGPTSPTASGVLVAPKLASLEHELARAKLAADASEPPSGTPTAATEGVRPGLAWLANGPESHPNWFVTYDERNKLAEATAARIVSLPKPASSAVKRAERFLIFELGAIRTGHVVCSYRCQLVLEQRVEDLDDSVFVPVELRDHWIMQNGRVIGMDEEDAGYLLTQLAWALCTRKEKGASITRITVRHFTKKQNRGSGATERFDDHDVHRFFCEHGHIRRGSPGSTTRPGQYRLEMPFGMPRMIQYYI